MKTIREWFEGLPVGYRELALSNLENFPINSDRIDAPSHAEALDCGFWWADTPEGEDFWDAVHDWVSDVASLLPPLPADNPLIQALRDALPFVELCGDNAKLSIPYSSSTAIRDEYADLEKRSGELSTRIRALLGEQPSATES